LAVVEAVQEIDAGAASPSGAPGCAASACISLFAQRGLRGERAPGCEVSREEAVVQVTCERCAGAGVGKDVIAVAVRAPGAGKKDGRKTEKRTCRAFCGVLREMAR
jgi:hypothetical protein